MEQRRVVVTGLGVVSSLGIGVEPFWASLLDGVSGISRIERVDVSDIPTQIAAEIKDFDIELIFDAEAPENSSVKVSGA